jgi:hypothetical protein
MKNRHIAVTLAICFVSSLTFADNPTDAPLMNSDTAPGVIRQSTPKSRKGPGGRDRSQMKKREKASAAHKDGGAVRNSHASHTPAQEREKS